MNTTDALPVKNNTLGTRRIKALPMASMLLSVITFAENAPAPRLDCAEWESIHFWRFATKQHVDNCIEQGGRFGKLPAHGDKPGCKP